MACATGRGATIAAVFTRNRFGSIDGTTALNTIVGQLDLQSIAEWTVNTGALEAPRLANGIGQYRRMCQEDDVTLEAWQAIAYFDGTVDLSLLVRAYGTITRTNPDGGAYAGSGWIASAIPVGSQESNVLTTAAITVQWDGLAGPTFTAPPA